MPNVENMPLGKGVILLSQERSGLVAFGKPAGVLSHPNKPADRHRSLLQADYDLAEGYYHWPSEQSQQYCYLLNRLDGPTSGIVLGARDHTIAQHGRLLFRQHQVEKIYRAIVRGVVPKKEQLWVDRLERTVHKGQLRVSPGVAQPAKTKVRGLGQARLGNVTLSLIELRPITGRTHQLRVQSALRRHPILGDKTYGDFRLNRRLLLASDERRLFLHAMAVSLNSHWQGRRLSFIVKCDCGESFKALWARAGGDRALWAQ